MKTKEIFGTTVLDKNANELGKVEDFEFDSETGKIDSIIISLKKNILGNGDELEVNYEDIATIGQYIILDVEIKDEE